MVLGFWKRIAIEAHKRTWAYLFGSIQKLILEAVVFGIAAFFLHYTGKESQMMDEITWAEALIIASALIYVPLFIINFVRLPSIFERKNIDEINNLKRRLRIDAEAPSFDLSLAVDRIEKEDAGSWRIRHGSFVTSERLCRLVVENVSSDYVTDVRVVVESGHPSGHDFEGVTVVDGLSLAPTEKKYVTIMKVENGSPATIYLSRKSESIVDTFQPKFDPSTEHTMILAVHGANASTRRIKISAGIQNNFFDVREADIPVVFKEGENVAGKVSQP